MTGTDGTENRQERDARSDAARIDVIEERLRIGKRRVESGGVRVSTVPETVTEAVRLALRQQQAAVDRVRVDRVVETAPEPRLEGDTVVIPIVEERVVTQLVVTEEIRVRLTETTREEARDVPLRRDRVVIDRIPSETEGSVPPEDGDTPAH